MARRAGCDGVASVGGGSSLDTAKLVAVLLSGEQPIADIYGVGKVKGGRMPLVLAPTTAGTGSEVTPIAIVTTGEAEKKGVVSPQLLPDWAILDAELTVGVPAHVTAATGIDAMVHAIEAFTSVHKKNPVSAELLVTLARLNAVQLSALHLAMVHEQERSGSAWTLEWMVLPQMLAATARALAVAQDMTQRIPRIGTP